MNFRKNQLIAGVSGFRPTNLAGLMSLSVGQRCNGVVKNTRRLGVWTRPAVEPAEDAESCTARRSSHSNPFHLLRQGFPSRRWSAQLRRQLDQRSSGLRIHFSIAGEGHAPADNIDWNDILSALAVPLDKVGAGFKLKRWAHSVPSWSTEPGDQCGG